MDLHGRNPVFTLLHSHFCSRYQLSQQVLRQEHGGEHRHCGYGVFAALRNPSDFIHRLPEATEPALADPDAVPEAQHDSALAQ